MIKSYSINGTSFKTVTIPQGTILFRGIHFENENKFANLFNDFIGVHTGHVRSIPPTMNVFFYPVPYVSDSVMIYSTHAMYITQYEIELILLIKPSSIVRSDKNKLNIDSGPIVTCNKLRYKDKCGLFMSDDDPCLTESVRKRFPQIDGYIGIAEQDASIFTMKFKNMVDENIDIVKQIIPSIIINSRELSGIPEIVIHPMRFRHDDCYNIRERFYSPEKVINYCIRNRALYNFFPLLYFNNNGIFTISDLKNIDNIKTLLNGERLCNSHEIPQLYNNINTVFSKMLDTGYTINNTVYRALIDSRTGFYRMFIDANSYNKTKRKTMKKTLRHFEDDDFKGYINTYVIRENNQLINNILSSHKKYINSFLNDLSVNGHSMKKKLLFNRGDKNKFIYNYYIEKVLDRPDLDEYKNIRKKRKNTTLKNINAKFSYMLGLNGFTASDLDDMSI
jgi:hypothetical protein